MNFQDLMSKLQAIEENTEMPAAECGMPVAIGHAEQPRQQDNVTMNVSMNGSGSGGIKDLMDILRNIEAGVEHGEDDVVFGEPGDEHGHAEPIIDVDMDEVYGNSPDEQTAGIDAVTPTGDDMASKGAEAPKVNGGGNPMQENLVSRLQSMYEEIKGEPLEEAGAKKNMSRAAKGNEKYGKDGMKELAKAGREGASEKELDAIRDKHDNYKESVNESTDILKLSKMLNG